MEHFLNQKSSLSHAVSYSQKHSVTDTISYDPVLSPFAYFSVFSADCVSSLCAACTENELSKLQGH